MWEDATSARGLLAKYESERMSRRSDRVVNEVAGVLTNNKGINVPPGVGVSTCLWVARISVIYPVICA